MDGGMEGLRLTDLAKVILIELIGQSLPLDRVGFLQLLRDHMSDLSTFNLQPESTLLPSGRELAVSMLTSPTAQFCNALRIIPVEGSESFGVVLVVVVLKGSRRNPPTKFSGTGYLCWNA